VPVNAAHCVWLSEEDTDLLAERHVGVVHCPGSNMKLASGIAPVPKLLAKGAVVGLGTDGAASNNNLDLLEEARLAALLHKVSLRDPKVISAEQALALATRGSAEALGLGDRIGTLEPGKRADIAILDLSAPHLAPSHHITSDLVYSARAGDVRHTIIDGVVVMKDRHFTQLDEAEIIAEASRRAHRLVSG
jgi:5-methylthioadenosine/S-adenosylhomocysteine deaminase